MISTDSNVYTWLNLPFFYLLLHSHKQANEIIAQLNVQDFLALVALYNSIDRCHWHNNSG